MKGIQSLVHFLEKIQYNFGENAINDLNVLGYRTFDFSPDMAMFSISYTVKKTFQRNSTTPESFDDAICFYFKNTVQEKSGISDAQTFIEKPVVHIFPYSATRISTFKKGEKVQMLCVILRISFLRGLLGRDAGKFDFLFDGYKNFLIEEVLTEDILQNVAEIIYGKPNEILSDFHGRMLALQLIFHLFKSLSNRSQTKFQKLNDRDIAAICRLKEALISDLSQPPALMDLSRIAGMNIAKMRKLFIQIFGTGIYDYFQKQRMLEAARLLREQHISVAEAGYTLGFENLSHFTRVFEQHIGIKPKAYSKLKQAIR